MKTGIYRHYKGNNYEVIGVAFHSETEEEFVVYKTLYNSEKYPVGSLWIRPKGMFFETIEIEGKTIPRFQYIGEKLS